MSSFKPYQVKYVSRKTFVTSFQKPPFFTAEFPVKQKSEIGIESKTSKINYMERTLENGNVVKIQVVNENAVRTLLANGFKVRVGFKLVKSLTNFMDLKNVFFNVSRYRMLSSCFQNL